MIMLYLITIILIALTGDRITGMELGVLPGLLSVHIVFGLIFLRFTLWIKLLISLIVGALVYVLVGQVIYYELVSTNWDLYGYWDLTLTNWLIGAIVWEASYHIMKVIENQKI